MNNYLIDAATALSTASSCAVMARWMHEIVGIIMASAPASRRGLLSCVLDILWQAAYKSMNEHKSQMGYSPWYIAIGTEANLIYLIHQLGDDNNSVDPRVQLTLIDRYASELEKTSNNPIRGVDHAKEIFSYCEQEFSCFSNSRFEISALILPDANIGWLAECCMLDETTFGMIVDAKNSSFQLCEIFAYELSALMVADEEVPEDAVELLAQTTAPNIEELSAEDRLWQYLMAIKAGLAYGGPYGCVVNGNASNLSHAKIWNKHLKTKLSQAIN